MNKHVKPLIAISIIEVVILVGVFLAPWFVDTFLLNLNAGLDQMIGYSAPLGLGLIVAIALKKNTQITIPTATPELRRLNPMLIVFGVILILAAQIVVNPLVDLIPDTFLETYTADHISIMQPGIWPMVAAILIAPTLEEWIFRGIIQRNIVRNIGAMRGILVAALLYGLVHIQPQMVVAYFAAGLVYGAIYFLTRSMATVVTTHCLYNGFMYLLYLMFNGVEVVSDHLFSTMESYVVAWAISAILLTLTGWWVVSHEAKQKK